MARGDEPEERSQAEIERAEARAAERARREERRRRRTEKRGKKEAAGEKEKSGKKDGAGWRERLRAAAQPDTEKKEESRSEVLQRRISAVVIVLVIVVVVMALTDSAPFFDDTSEEERVADTVERFFAAYRDGDTQTMCDLFSPDVKRTIEAAGATEAKGEDPASCSDVLAARVGDGQDVSVKVDEVRVSGPRAIANLVLKTPDAARRQIEAVELEMSPDGWLLTSPIVTS